MISLFQKYVRLVNYGTNISMSIVFSLASNLFAVIYTSVVFFVFVGTAMLQLLVILKTLNRGARVFLACHYQTI